MKPSKRIVFRSTPGSVVGSIGPNKVWHAVDLPFRIQRWDYDMPMRSHCYYITYTETDKRLTECQTLAECREYIAEFLES